MHLVTLLEIFDTQEHIRAFLSTNKVIDPERWCNVPRPTECDTNQHRHFRQQFQEALEDVSINDCESWADKLKKPENRHSLYNSLD